MSNQKFEKTPAHNRFFRIKNALCVFLVGRTSAHSHVRSVVRIAVARSYAFGRSVIRFGRSVVRSVVRSYVRSYTFGRTKIVPHLVPHEALIEALFLYDRKLEYIF